MSLGLLSQGASLAGHPIARGKGKFRPTACPRFWIRLPVWNFGLFLGFEARFQPNFITGPRACLGARAASRSTRSTRIADRSPLLACGDFGLIELEQRHPARPPCRLSRVSTHCHCHTRSARDRPPRFPADQETLTALQPARPPSACQSACLLACLLPVWH